jgi:hypothetical protein
MRRSTFPALFLIPALTLLASVSSPAQTTADYVITGRVVDESNRGVAGVWVFAKPHDYHQVQGPLRVARRALTDGNGDFSIPVGRPARYELFPEKSEAGYFIQFSPVFRHPAVPIVEVVLTETEKTASAVVTLAPKNGVLVGKSIDAATGRPIETLHFLFCLSINPIVCWSTSVKNARGEFQILTPHVPFTLRATADAYDTWFGLNGFQNNEPISIASGTTMEVVFHLKRRPDAVNRALDESEKQRPVNLSAPIQSSPTDRNELKGFPRPTRLEWQPVEGAASYRVEVDYCDGLVKGRRECLNPQPHPGMKWPIQVNATSFEFLFVGTQPGRWRVWATDKNGQEGFKSPWWTFFYIE